MNDAIGGHMCSFLQASKDEGDYSCLADEIQAHLHCVVGDPLIHVLQTPVATLVQVAFLSYVQSPLQVL